MIRFTGVTKKFKNKTVIENINLHIQKGELVVIVGPSGCGKTTTLKLINRLIKLSSGTISIQNTDISTQDVITLRRKMGYVIQQTGLFPHMTIRENIEIIPKLNKEDSTHITNNTLRLMDMVGLDPNLYLDQYPAQLSGGQQQRVGVARAFATDPDIILMDEPFSALDPITRTGLQDELIRLQQKLKKTIVFVTHDMDEAIKIADRICIMNEGHIVQYDTPENILKNPANDFVREFVGVNRIWNAPELIRAKDIMIENPVICTSNISLLKCLDKMRGSKVDTLLVVDENKNLIGTVAAKYIRYIPSDTLVKEVITPVTITASPDDSIIDILNKLHGTTTTNLPVLDKDNHLVGLITKSSLVTTLSHQFLDLKEVI